LLYGYLIWVFKMGLQLQHIERSIFEAVRLRAVALGCTPDITTFPDTPLGLQQYQQALSQILSSKGFAFEIFGTEAPYFRGQEKFARITLNHNSLIPGEYGIDPGGELVQEGTEFHRVFSNNLVYEYYLDCILLADSQAVLRIGQDILYGALPVMGYLPFYPEVDEDPFLMKLDTVTSLNKDSTGFMGKTLTYLVPDVFISEDISENTPVVPLTEITLETTLSQYLGIGALTTELLIK